MRRRDFAGTSRCAASFYSLRRLQVGGQRLARQALPGSFPHLFRRFFDFVSSRPLTDVEIETVTAWLTPAEGELFFAQDSRDQRHGFNAGASVAAIYPGDRSAISAGALHDVGKRHAGLGAVGRSVASILIKLRLPLSRRMLMYRDHGEIGAADLISIGSAGVVVSFARSHHGQCPADIDPGLWEVLQESDR